MINCNPETVSTDYDTSDRLYFEPLTFEDVSAVLDNERPDGVLVQFGGQTPLKLARPLEAAGYPIAGRRPNRSTSPRTAAASGSSSASSACARPSTRRREPRRKRSSGAADRLSPDGPALLCPRGAAPWRSSSTTHISRTTCRARTRASPEHPVLIDRFLDDAFEYDVDALSDGKETWIGGIQQHIEEAGIHSGDSFSVLPAWKVTPEQLAEMRDATRRLAEALSVKGLVNIQFATQRGSLYVLEVNPRASRTVPFVSKAIGVADGKGSRAPRGRPAARVPRPPARARSGGLLHQGAGLSVQEVPGRGQPPRPRDEVDGRGHGDLPRFGDAFAKACEAVGIPLPLEGRAFSDGQSVRQGDADSDRARARRTCGSRSAPRRGPGGRSPRRG
jgi:carbamoyl-phosphate synthase large subunit